MSSPAWWVGVVLVGLLINLASAYVKPSLDHIVAALGCRWREKAQKRKDAYEAEISGLSESIELQRRYEHKHIASLLQALFGLAFAALLIGMKVLTVTFPQLSIARDFGVSPSVSTSIFHLMVSLILLASMKLYFYASALENKVSEARERAEAARVGQ